METAGPGVYHDGGGLYLVVRDSGRRSWILRYQIAKRRRDMGLGGYPAIKLAKAREIAAQKRELIAQGIDPLEERKLLKPAALTFRTAAEALIEAKAPGWKNAKHAAQWASTLEAHVYPKLGNRAVETITTEDVLSALRPIWTRTPETASRVRQRIEAVLSFAAAMGARSGENPARWRGHLDQLLAKPSKVRAVTHFAAMPWQELPEFWQLLSEREGVAALALRFAILTAARSGEVRGATWGEIDLEAKLWTVPASRMKGGRQHRVPLSGPALAILDRARGLDPTLVFPGTRRARPLSDMSLTAVLRRMTEAGEIAASVTAHGFRASFRMWAGESTAHPREVAEHALAHKLPDAVEAAYARGDLLDKRRVLLGDWALFVTKN